MSQLAKLRDIEDELQRKAVELRLFLGTGLLSGEEKTAVESAISGLLKASTKLAVRVSTLHAIERDRRALPVSPKPADTKIERSI